MKKLAVLITLSFTCIASSAVLAKDSVNIEKKAFKQDSEAAQLREKVNEDKFKSTEAMDKGHKGTAAKYAKRAAKTARIAKQHEKLADKLNKKAEKMERKETR